MTWRMVLSKVFWYLQYVCILYLETSCVLVHKNVKKQSWPNKFPWDSYAEYESLCLLRVWTHDYTLYIFNELQYVQYLQKSKRTDHFVHPFTVIVITVPDYLKHLYKDHTAKSMCTPDNHATKCPPPPLGQKDELSHNL